jgi:translation elongation factor EF-4
MLNGVIVEELSCICHYQRAVQHGKDLVGKLVELIPRQQYVVSKICTFCPFDKLKLVFYLKI